MEKLNFYKGKIYPLLVNKFGNPLPMKKIRQKIIPRAQGVVLEIGFGAGANFPYYDPAKVSKLYALEPNCGMLRMAEPLLRESVLNFEILDLRGEQIPLRTKQLIRL